jgi:hypothetical protein
VRRELIISLSSLPGLTRQAILFENPGGFF